MNNAIYELLVPRANLLRDQLIRILLIVLIVVLIAASPFTGFLSLWAAVILGVVSWLFVFPRFHIEYEYTLVNHNLDIDIIYNKAKRKQLFSFDLKQAEIIAPVNSSQLNSFTGLKTTDCSARTADSIPYAVIIPVNHERKRILIQPDDGMLVFMKGFLPRTLVTGE